MLKKVLTGTILGLVLFVLGSVTMDQVLQRQAEQYQRVIDLFFPLQEKTDELHLLLLQQQAIVDKAILDAGRELAELRAASNAYGDAILGCFAVCLDLLATQNDDLDEVSRELAVELGTTKLSFDDYSDHLAAFFDHLQSRPVDDYGDSAELASSLEARATSLQDSVARFENMLARSNQRAQERASTVLSSVRRVFVGMVGAAVLLGIFANIFFYRSLLPLTSMADAVRAITRGSYEVRVPTEGHDELSFLASEFNAMAQALGDQRRALERSQRFLRQSEKFAAIGELSLGIAHEVRNPLSTIQMTLDSLRKRSDLDTIESERVGLALHEVDRLEGLVSSLLNYGRPTAPRLAMVEMQLLIERSTQLVEAECRRCGVSVSVASHNGALPEIEIDQDQIIQVLVNLLLNAIQASPSSTDVRVVTAVEADSSGGETVAIRIIDEGVGIDAEEQKRIFTPFFTTRRDGTGLGLPLARKIAEAHGGELAVSSLVGQGTTATLRLPIKSISHEDA